MHAELPHNMRALQNTTSVFIYLQKTSRYECGVIYVQLPVRWAYVTIAGYIK